MASIMKGVLNREEAFSSLAVARQLQQKYAGKCGVMLLQSYDMQGFFKINITIYTMITGHLHDDEDEGHYIITFMRDGVFNIQK